MNLNSSTRLLQLNAERKTTFSRLDSWLAGNVSIITNAFRESAMKRPMFVLAGKKELAVVTTWIATMTYHADSNQYGLSQPLASQEVM